MENGFIFKLLRVLLVLFLAAAVAAGLVLMKPKTQRRAKEEKGYLVEVQPVTSRTVSMIVETYGTVIPRTPLNLVAEVPGKIVGMDPSFEEGGYFTEGSVLITIDPRDYRLQVDQRKAALAQAEAELVRLNQDIVNLRASIRIAREDTELALAEFERLKTLAKRNVTSRNSRDQAEQQYLASRQQRQSLENQLAVTGPARLRLEANRDLARVMLKQARLNLEKTQIVAPFNGWVLSKDVEQGQYVSTGTYLGRTYRKGLLDIDISLTRSELRWLDPSAHHDGNSEVDIFYGSNGYLSSWKGHISRIKASLDTDTRTFPAVISVDGPSTQSQPFTLKPGMFVNVNIRGQKIPGLFELPRHVLHSPNMIYVFEKNRLRIREVNVVRRFKETVFLDAGLSDGDRVITTPLPGATEGMPVRIQSSKSAKK